MEFLKKNYEKILLAIVLLGLTGAVGFLLILIPEKQKELQDSLETKVKSKIEPLAALDLSPEEAAADRAKKPLKLDFTTKHNLFNPVQWRKSVPEGRLIKLETGNEIGPGALQVTAITPLYLKLEYDSPTGASYLVRIIRQTAIRNQEQNSFVSMDNTSGPLKLDKVNGPPEKPESLELILKETGERIVVGPDKLFSRVDGYSADLKYPPDPSLPPMNGKRTNEGQNILNFGGARYRIQAIHANDVVILDQSNNKKTTIPFIPSPGSR
jgi:hypothetical protein